MLYELCLSIHFETFYSSSTSRPTYITQDVYQDRTNPVRHTERERERGRQEFSPDSLGALRSPMLSSHSLYLIWAEGWNRVIPPNEQKIVAEPIEKARARLAPCAADIFLSLLSIRGMDKDESGDGGSVQGRSHPSRPGGRVFPCLCFFFFFFFFFPGEMTGRQRTQAANEGETLSPWLSARCEGRCRYQSIHWNKWERCGVEANGNDSVLQWHKCHPFIYLFSKDRGGNLITYFQLSLISTPGLMQYLQSHREHCITGAHPEIIYTPVVCLRPWSVFHIFLRIEKVTLQTALWVGILNRILMFFTIWTNWIDALSGWLIYSISAEMKKERETTWDKTFKLKNDRRLRVLQPLWLKVQWMCHVIL